MGNNQAAQREALERDFDQTGQKHAREKLLQTSWYQKLEELKTLITGTVHLPEDEDGVYNEARKRAWNKDQRGFPAAIVRVMNTSDVAATIRFIRANVPAEVSVCIAGGCHSSRSMVTGCIVIDLVNLKQVTFDSNTQRVTAGGGAYLQDLDEALEPHNRAVPVGTYPKTGVGGLSLGGGFGWLSRMYGLTVDNLVEAEVVLNDGRIVMATEENEHADLLWGLRGGGGNFGVVTKFIFQTHVLPSHVLAGNIVKLAPTLAAAKTIMTNFDKAVDTLPVNISAGIVIPAGAPVVPTLWAYFGEESNPANIAAFQQAPSFGGWPTVENSVKKCSYYRDLQHSTEPMNPMGYDYHTVVPFGQLHQLMEEKFIDELLTFARKSVPPKVEKAVVIFLYLGQTDGVRDGQNEKTVIPRPIREARYFCLIQAAWQPEHGSEGKAAAKQWVKTIHQMATPYATPIYAPDEVNASKQEHTIMDGNDRYFGFSPEILRRLVAVKTKYDAENFFRMNTNIKPT